MTAPIADLIVSLSRGTAAARVFLQTLANERAGLPVGRHRRWEQILADAKARDALLADVPEDPEDIAEARQWARSRRSLLRGCHGCRGGIPSAASGKQQTEQQHPPSMQKMARCLWDMSHAAIKRNVLLHGHASDD